MAAAGLLQVNYTPRPWLWVLEAVKSLFSFLSSLDLIIRGHKTVFMHD